MGFQVSMHNSVRMTVMQGIKQLINVTLWTKQNGWSSVKTQTCLIKYCGFIIKISGTDFHLFLWQENPSLSDNSSDQSSGNSQGLLNYFFPAKLKLISGIKKAQRTYCTNGLIDFSGIKNSITGTNFKRVCAKWKKARTA